MKPKCKQKRMSCCVDCGKDWLDFDYYMVWDYLWKKCNLERADHICFPCLETRLKREIKSSDFPDYPINIQYRK